MATLLNNAQAKVCFLETRPVNFVHWWLINDSLSSLYYTASNFWMIINVKLERMWKEAVVT
jgi:hypothetical protein